MWVLPRAGLYCGRRPLSQGDSSKLEALRHWGIEKLGAISDKQVGGCISGTLNCHILELQGKWLCHSNPPIKETEGGKYLTVFQGCRTINLIILYDKKVPTVCFVASCQNPDLHVENLTKATLFLLMKVKEESENWLKAQHSEKKDHGIQSHHFMANRWGNSGNSGWLYFSGMVMAAIKLKDAYSLEGKLWPT